MTWKDFLKKISRATEINLVGPLFDSSARPAAPVIYVDGGLRAKPAAATEPAVSVGDGDSASLPLDEVLPRRKDFSDLAFALRELPISVKQIRLFGFLGGRRDHELANFGEVQKFLRDRPGSKAIFFRDSKPTVIAFGCGEWALEVHGIFSAFVLEATEVQIMGKCRYELPRPTRFEPLSSHGLSNEGFGEVHVSCSSPIFLFLEF